MLPNDNIGYPKLFMSRQRASEKHVQQVVNNFAANWAATVSDWPLVSISVSVLAGCQHRRVRPANDQSL
jgi:hypothetical protein